MEVVNATKKKYSVVNVVINSQLKLGVVIVNTLEALTVRNVEQLTIFPLTLPEKYMPSVTNLLALLEAASTRDGFSLVFCSDHLRQKIIFMIN